MNIINNSTYNNQIYKAIVVNNAHDSDPNGEHRVQIFIPEKQINLQDEYQSYMSASNKESTGSMDKYPWAISLVENLNNGDIVYGNFVANENGQFIILGLQANIPKTNAQIAGSAYNLNGKQLVDYATAIILANEVGINPDDYLNNNIGDSEYGYIDGNDNGAFSIGLLQWHGTNAFNLLCKITTNLPNWENCWSDKSLYLYLDLKTGQQRYNNYSSYKISNYSTEYNCIKAMLISEEGKQTQLQHSSDFIFNYINDLSDSYGIKNPAVLIFLADLMNQYGPGITNTKNAARDICNNNSDIIGALEAVYSWCESNISTFNRYKNRRQNTKNYAISLYQAGKLSAGGLLDVNIAPNANYCYPFSGSAFISATYGPGGYRTYNSAYQYKMRGIMHYHEGVDFAMGIGTELLAVYSGTVHNKASSGGYGNYVELMTDDGMMVLYGHCSSHEVEDGARVEMGQVIALSGNSGNSSGPHLHFEIREAPFGVLDDVNPLPYIGIMENHELYDTWIEF